MTRAPRTIGPDALAAEALHAMDARVRSPRCSWWTTRARRSASCTSTTCCGRASRDHRLPGSGSRPPREARRRCACASPRAAPAPAATCRPRGSGARRGRRSSRAAASCVGLAKRLLPVLALALLAVMVFWPEIEGNDERSRVAFRRVAQPRAESLRVVAPRYQGVDEQSRPYTVTAAVAQQVGGEQILDLEAPRGDMVLTDGGWVHAAPTPAATTGRSTSSTSPAT